MAASPSNNKIRQTIKKMRKNILETDTTNTALLIARVGVAFVILPHGLQKAFGLFGGGGFDGTMQYFTETVGIPWILGLLVIAAESLGTLMLAVGILSRFVAISLIAVMIGAAAQHAPNGFFMNWFGNQAGEGLEFFILAVSLALPVAIFGGGRWSADGWLSGKATKTENVFDRKLETTP